MHIGAVVSFENKNPAPKNVQCRGNTLCGIQCHSLPYWIDHYLALTNISKKWTMPIKDWKSALNQFSIMFEERLPNF